MADSTVSAQILWKNALDALRQQGQAYVVSQLLQLHPLRFESGTLLLGVEDLFFRDWVDDHYAPGMQPALTEAAGRPVHVQWEKVEKRDVPGVSLPPR